MGCYRRPHAPPPLSPPASSAGVWALPFSGFTSALRVDMTKDLRACRAHRRAGHVRTATVRPRMAWHRGGRNRPMGCSSGKALFGGRSRSHRVFIIIGSVYYSSVARSLITNPAIGTLAGVHGGCLSSSGDIIHSDLHLFIFARVHHLSANLTALESSSMARFQGMPRETLAGRMACIDRAGRARQVKNRV